MVDRTATPAGVERHLSGRGGWLRAMVLGANDGILSTAGVILGVAAADNTRSAVVIAGVASLVAGALSMAAGEYVSVGSQRDVEEADLERERAELAGDPAGELEELAAIYEARGVSPGLARQVAEELSAGDVLAVHARDELGIETTRLARPLQAAVASALAFSIGAAMPLAAAGLATAGARIPIVAGVTVVALIVLGDVGARLGGAPRLPAVARVTLWGVIAMALTTAIGALVGTAL